jgi:hypothetical protein
MPAVSSAWRQLSPGGQPDRRDDNISKAVTGRDLNASANRRSDRLVDPSACLHQPRWNGDSARVRGRPGRRRARDVAGLGDQVVEQLVRCDCAIMLLVAMRARRLPPRPHQPGPAFSHPGHRQTLRDSGSVNPGRLVDAGVVENRGEILLIMTSFMVQPPEGMRYREASQQEGEQASPEPVVPRYIIAMPVRGSRRSRAWSRLRPRRRPGPRRGRAGRG